MIYIFGNSHVNFFTNSHPGTEKTQTNNIFTYNLGPTIAYNFYEHHFPAVLNWVTYYKLPQNTPILLCVGEVDCRLHIPQQAELQKRSIYDVAEECVDRFFRCFLDLQHYGYKPIGWGGHPSTMSPHNMNDPEALIYGDPLTRNKTSLFWSNYLERKCRIHNIHFLSIISKLINKDCSTKMEYFSDYCHLNKKILPLVTETLLSFEQGINNG